ncbi:MAG: TIM barrel protein, partial [Anaerolineae bacterium]
MNKIGIYYAYWTRDWDVDFHPFIDKIAGLGFDVLEVNAATIVTMTAKERRALKAHAEDRGVALSYCIGLPPTYDISSADEDVRQNGIKYLQEIAQAIGEMDGGILGGIIYGSWPAATAPEGEMDKRPFLDRSIASMREAIKAAEDSDVIFTVEVVNRFEQFLLNTCEEALAYVEAVESPNLKIMLDTFHM